MPMPQIMFDAYHRVMRQWITKHEQETLQREYAAMLKVELATIPTLKKSN